MSILDTEADRKMEGTSCVILSDFNITRRMIYDSQLVLSLCWQMQVVGW